MPQKIKNCAIFDHSCFLPADQTDAFPHWLHFGAPLNVVPQFITHSYPSPSTPAPNVPSLPASPPHLAPLPILLCVSKQCFPSLQKSSDKCRYIKDSCCIGKLCLASEWRNGGSYWPGSHHKTGLTTLPLIPRASTWLFFPNTGYNVYLRQWGYDINAVFGCLCSPFSFISYSFWTILCMVYFIFKSLSPSHVGHLSKQHFLWKPRQPAV